MHGIDLSDLGLIKNEIQATSLLTYQIMDFNESDLSLTLYLRMIDLKSMKVLTSAIIRLGDRFESKAEEEINMFNEAYEIIKNIISTPF